MLKQCKYFNANKMAAYIEGNLNDIEKEKYETHLFNCDYCLSIYFNIKEEIKIMKQVTPVPVPDRLFNTITDKVLEKNVKKKIRQKVTEIIIKMYEKGMELIGTSNIKSITPIPVPSVRSDRSKLLKKIIIENDKKGLLYKILIDFYSHNRIKVTLNFLEIEDSLKTENIKLESPDGKVISSFKTEASFDDLSKGTYKLKLKNITLSKINIK